MSRLKKNEILNSDIPSTAPRAKDPHHNGFSEWCFFKCVSCGFEANAGFDLLVSIFYFKKLKTYK